MNNWFQVCMDPVFDIKILKPAKHLYINFEDAGDEAIKLIARIGGISHYISH